MTSRDEIHCPPTTLVPVVVMGVSGSGKSTVGTVLAHRLRVPFADADTFHSKANITKMAAGEPLTDQDRYPWLEAVGEWLAQHGDGGVMSCSALKRTYRDQLRSHCPQIEFLHLTGSPELIASRHTSRPGHFMPPALLRSQLETLEPLGPDENGVAVDVGPNVEIVVDTFITQFAKRRRP